mgnify:CR=1 FL=1
MNKNISTIRKLIRQILKEEQQAQPVIPKNKWVLLASGDPRRELVKNQLFDLVQQTYAPIGGHFKIKNPVNKT